MDVALPPLVARDLTTLKTVRTTSHLVGGKTVRVCNTDPKTLSLNLHATWYYNHAMVKDVLYKWPTHVVLRYDCLPGGPSFTYVINEGVNEEELRRFIETDPFKVYVAMLNTLIRANVREAVTRKARSLLREFKPMNG